MGIVAERFVTWFVGTCRIGSITFPVQNFNCLQKRGEGKVCELCFGRSSFVKFRDIEGEMGRGKKDTEELEVFPIRLH